MSRSIYCRHLVFLVVLAFGAASVLASDTAEKKADKTEQKDEKKPAAAAPDTKTVKKGPFQIVVELEGVFDADDAHEIQLEPKEWSKLTVVRAAQLGARVRKGDVILEFEVDKLDRAIADLRDELRLSELAIRQTEERLQALEKSTPMNLEASRRAAKIAEEDRALFFEVMKPLQLRVAEFNMKSIRWYVEYQEEELRQLEKMYKADDITEETEQIVLKRARDSLERAKFLLQLYQVINDNTLKYVLPRMEETVKETAKRAKLELEKNEAELPLALDMQRLELEKMRRDRKHSEERLEDLTADREKMTVRSPIDGIVYYGQFTRGRPADASSMESTLRPQGTVPPNQVVMTVVSPRPMFLRTTIAEDKLDDLRPGLKGTAVPTGFPNLRFPVEIDRVSDVPIAPGQFDGRLMVHLKGKTKLLMPGMTCKIKLVPYVKRDAVLVPPTAVVTDEFDEEKHSVEVLGKDGKTQTRPVTIGRKTDKQVEVLKGLKVGEKVVLEPSKDKDKE